MRTRVAYGKKICCRCHQEKKASEFGVSNTRPDGLTSACKACLGPYMRVHVRKWNEKWKKEHGGVSYATYRAQLIRLEALAHYGGKCTCCGEDHPEFLAFDHVNGGGGKHKAKYKIRHLERWLKRNGYPDGFRILCHNCNQAMGYYRTCPHQTEREHA